MNNYKGLTAREAADLLETHGPNKLPEASPPGILLIFFKQYQSPFIYVLLAAALVSLALGQIINAVFIFIVLLLNATIGTFQEFAAQRAATGLEKMVPRRANVIRDDCPVTIDAVELVPGDILLLESGDLVPADAKLLEVKGLQADESLLTGESLGVSKVTTQVESDFGESSFKIDHAYAGSTVLRGRATGLVTATGSHTELGKIAQDVSTGEVAWPPLMQRIHEFTMRISWGMMILIGIIFVITLLRGDDLTTVFFLGVALAVSAIPEGLPVAITVALSIGMQRMARHGVIIRNLVAVESLGSCTYIASDKTGTLTVNEMTIRDLVLPCGTALHVKGEGSRMSPDYILPASEFSEGVRHLVLAGLMTNEAHLDRKDNQLTTYGDSVDIAFLVLAEKNGLNPQHERDHHPILLELPYESENAFSASVRDIAGSPALFVKGSVERLQAMCSPDYSDTMAVAAEELAVQGYRVIALASKNLDAQPEDIGSTLQDLDYLGVVGIIDPLRPEAIDAVRQCREADIRIAMVTGDHPDTAAVLAAELGIARHSIDRDGDRPVTGADLAKAFEEGESTADRLIAGSRVFARVEPRQKMEIVESLIRNGHFVAVTGDGVNDAPALKHAHIGVAMGQRGSDVARESADMILTNDNFASIVEGVRQGRVVYNNIRKVIFLLISTGGAEITLIMLSLLFGLPLPLLPLQLLWLNLVTNGIQDVALVFEPEEGDELKKPPRQPDEPIFDRLMIERVVINAVVMGVLAFAVFYWQIYQGVEETAARNITLLLMVLFENVHVLNSRSETRSIFRHKFFSNPFLLFGMLAAQGVHILAMHFPPLGDILQISPVSLTLWTQLLGIACLLVIVDEVHKYFMHRKTGNHKKSNDQPGRPDTKWSNMAKD